MTPSNILLVDDREENLVALRAVLEPLGQNLVATRSGEDALRELLKHEFAVILLDVQMPGFDGFQTAELIKQREQTKHVPIIFVTAISKDAEHVFRGYSAGAVDYILKPIDPDVLRSKVSVFVQLWEKEQQLAEQAERLRVHEVAEAVQESEERYRFLAESIPQQVFTATPEGVIDYVNERVVQYFGGSFDEPVEPPWSEVHPEDLAQVMARWTDAINTGESLEVEFRLRRADGAYRWHLTRAVPMHDAEGRVVKWFGTSTDIHDKKRAEEAQRFLIEAGAILGRSLHYEQALKDVARAAVPGIADWCMVDLLEPDGSLRLLAAAHVDAIKVKLAHELRERYPPASDSERGAIQVIRTGEPQLVETVTDEEIDQNARDEIHRDLLRELGIQSYLSVPLRARDRTIGAITFVHAESGRTYGPNDLGLAEELARRAGMAIENAELYEEVEKRAEAARVLESVGDGVVLIDREGIIRLWNPAAEAITGFPPGEVEGRVAREVVPGWAELEPRIPVGKHGSVRAEMLPIDIGGRELWLSISGVGFDEGTVYAFRDLTEERALEQLKSDFVATVSHEIRTPLAAVHGAALTLLRPDLTFSDELRDRLLAVVAEESDRLARIVNDLLIASHLDSGRLPVSIESCDAKELAESVVEAANLSVPDGITVSLSAPARLPQVAADPGQLRQVLANLVDNAIKYSPGGGPVEVRLAKSDAFMRFEVEDRGLGIPPNEHRRVFEKFYRLDPNMTNGVGGTGLGLYISRELVRTMDGRIWVDSKLGEGSTFLVEIPLARKPRGTRPPRKKAAAGA
jgi:PAS domain S-box-containing protein